MKTFMLEEQQGTEKRKGANTSIPHLDCLTWRMMSFICMHNMANIPTTTLSYTAIILSVISMEFNT
jgi:hypothetical protein